MTVPREPTVVLGGTTRRVNVSAAGVEASGTIDPTPSARSWGGVVGADGEHVLYWSEANNLVSDDTNGVGDLFVYDRRSRVTLRVVVPSLIHRLGHIF